MSDPARLVPPTVSARAANSGRWPAAFGPRFFLGLVLGLVWMGPAWWDRRFAAAMLGWDALLVVAWFLDFRLLPKPGQVEVSRIWLGAVSLGVQSGVALEVRNLTRTSFRAVLYDELPASFRSEPPRIELNVPRHSTAQGSYEIRPTERGDLMSGRAFLRLQSPLKLAERWLVAGLRQTVRVYPNLQDPKRHTLYLIRSRQIELEKRLHRQVGLGREFENLREYRLGDEPRDVCWTATARRGKLITKVYHTERSQAVLIVVDAGRLMLARVGSELSSPTKLDHAVGAALTLAHVALYSGDRAGLLAYGRRPQARLGAARGAAHLHSFLDRLALVRGELVEADHAGAADMLLSLQTQRSLVVWLTDLAETAATPEVIDAASRLLRRHLVLFAAMGQPQLEHLVASRPESADEMYRYVAAQEMVERRELLLRRLREQGVLTLEVEPGRLATGLVNQYLQIKERSLI